MPGWMDRFVILREVSHRDFVAPLDGSGVDGERLILNTGRACDQRTHQRGLADAVAAHQRDLFSARDAAQ